MGILKNLFNDLFLKQDGENITHPTLSVRRVLNVGGGSKSIMIPSHFSGWQHDLLDIDPRGQPDIVCDARKLTVLTGGKYEAVYCSHNLEHYYRHEAVDVVRGFLHILKSDGFAEIHVPDIAQVIKALGDKKLAIDDVLYQSAAGPISAHDVIYGLQTEIQSSGKDFYSHKTGFTPNSLVAILLNNGFTKIFIRTDEYLAIHALAFKTEPMEEHYDLFRDTWNIENRVAISSLEKL